MDPPSGFCAYSAITFARRPRRREWDSNPRWVAPHTLSKRADSAALASLQGLLAPGPEQPAGEPPVRSAVAQAIVWANPLSHVMVGSCATPAREPSQGRE